MSTLRRGQYAPRLYTGPTKNGVSLRAHRDQNWIIVANHSSSTHTLLILEHPDFSITFTIRYRYSRNHGTPFPLPLPALLD